MKTILLISTLAVSSILFTGYKTKTPETELCTHNCMTKLLLDTMQSEGITHLHRWTGVVQGTGNDYTFIGNDMIKIQSRFYDLRTLYKFKVESFKTESDSEKRILLYFRDDY